MTAQLNHAALLFALHGAIGVARQRQHKYTYYREYTLVFVPVAESINTPLLGGGNYCRHAGQ